MTSYDQLVQAISCRFHDRIESYCRPLLNLLKVSHFWYYKLTNNGSFSVISSHVAWAEFLAEEKFYLHYPYFRHPKYFQNEVSIIRIGNKRLSKFLAVGKEKFNLHDSIQVINKTANGLEGFGFSVASSEESHITLLLNELPLLRFFIKKFREENRILLNHFEDNQIDAAKLVGSLFHEKPSSEKLSSPDRQAFLSSMGITNPLTPRETDIARLLAKSFSASQIKKQVFLSKRTIEHHVERMKEKLGCESRAELAQKARELEELGYLNVCV